MYQVLLICTFSNLPIKKNVLDFLQINFKAQMHIIYKLRDPPKVPSQKMEIPVSGM